MPAPSIFGEPTKTLSVVVPAYNEEERLAPMLEEMLASLQKRRDRQVGATPTRVGPVRHMCAAGRGRTCLQAERHQPDCAHAVCLSGARMKAS